ncbi:DUF86 domain-containing protein [Algoriphagus sp. H41]|uniref:DUF86 domain-containing protein n=1 Tax=Algoriphagus oliviformis TaxID=2811231 RepID=A0ABS3C7N0_9BACT|nr:HepT-like ribonuclease domain-containing protein [Algoriphagus oliviformis]MBN7812161.1 DUF86 domain-containing protein [Algoriphagus oliviformis]
MKLKVVTRLLDIRTAIDQIYGFLPQPLDYFAFKKDLKTRKAVERNIEIIGEAVNQLLKLEPEIRISNSRKIVDTRNRIIHGYDSVASETIWGIAVKHLPKLRNEITILLEHYGFDDQE